MLVNNEAQDRLRTVDAARSELEATRGSGLPAELQPFRSAIDLTVDAVFFAETPHLRLLDVNRSACDVLGYSRDELLQKTLVDVCPDLGVSTQPISFSLENGDEQKIITKLRTSEGGSIPVEKRLTRISASDTEILVAVARDVHDTSWIDRADANDPYRDHLTGLPCRSLLEQRLRRAHDQAFCSKSQYGVLFVDLDGFKQINDRHGHAAGDHVLKVVAERITQCVRPIDGVARFGGDEFVVLIDHVKRRRAAKLVARRIRRSIVAPIEFRGLSLRVAASIGVAIGSSASSSALEILEAADLAMYQMKRQKRQE